MNRKPFYTDNLNAKDRGTIKSTAWGTETCLVLSFVVTVDINNKPVPKTSRALSCPAQIIKDKKELQKLRIATQNNTPHIEPFSIEQITMAPRDTKIGKAPGFDEIHPEFLLHCSKFAYIGYKHVER